MKNLSFHISEALELILKQRWTAFLMVLSMTIMMSLLAVSLSGILIFSSLVEALRSESEIDVFLASGQMSSAETYNALAYRIKQIPDVAEVAVVSAEEAEAKMAALLGEQQHVLESFDTNPFEGYIAVKIVPEAANEIIPLISAMDGVEYVRDNQAVIESIQSISRSVQTASGVIMFGVSIGAFIVMMGIIRQSVLKRREKIETLVLLGAPKGFVETPFYIEGLVMSLCGALGAYAVNSLLMAKLYASMSELYMFLPLPDQSHLIQLTFVSLVSFALITGIIGSLFGLKTAQLD